MENHVVELVQPRHTLIGENSILEIPQFLHRLEGTVTALVVTDQGLVKIGTVKKVTDVLDRAGIRYWTYDGVATESLGWRCQQGDGTVYPSGL